MKNPARSTSKMDVVEIDHARDSTARGATFANPALEGPSYETEEETGRPEPVLSSSRAADRGSQGGSGTQGNPGASTPERGRGSEGERNSSSSGGGISNRGMDSEEEQEDLPDRGFEREPGDSER